MAMSPKVTPRFRLLIPLALVIILIVVAISVVLQIQKDQKTTDVMLEFANSFTIPSDWQLESSNVTRAQSICLSDTKCPSLWKRWKISNPLNLSQFEAVAHSSSYHTPSVEITRACYKQPSNVTGTDLPFCQAKIISGAYTAIINTYYSTDQENRYRADLSVEMRE